MTDPRPPAGPAPIGPGPTAPPIPRAIAIDGPASSGKSTIGRLLAERLGYLFFDTGAMYRAVTWAALQRGVPLDDGEALAALTESLPVEIRRPTGAEGDGRAYSVFIAGDDRTWDIRDPTVEAAVSAVSAWPGVRHALVEQQRRVAAGAGAPGGPAGVVMAGRDIGTVVLPNAPRKIYLDASAAERARRRYRETVARGEPADYERTLADITRRDYIDSHRATSPLRAAPDAVRVVTDGLSVEEVLATALRVVQTGAL